MSTAESLAALSEAELMMLERDIARKHIDKFPYLAVAWASANLLIWLALWPLVLTGAMPLWLGFIMATFNIMLSYLPSHEAQHDIIAKPGTPLRWLNEAVGHLSTLPLVLPYRVAKATHMEHHKHANNPELDPDFSTHANGPWAAVWQSFKNRQPRAEAGLKAYSDALIRIKRPQLIVDGILYELAYYGILIGMAWTGHAMEAALLWWLPRHIALTYIQFYLSWAPHHPASETGRYRDTRSFRSVLGNIGSMGMQYHVVHHLHPRIPLYRTPQAYWEMKPVLEARGARIDEL